MEQVACALCGSTNAIPMWTLPDYLLSRNDVAAKLVKCNSCGLVYQNPRPTLEEMVTHYPPDYESFTPEPNEKNSSWFLEQAVRYGISKRSRFVTRHKPSGRLLDVGCATGTFLQGMRAHGHWEVYGVEVNEYAARIARERYQLDVRVGTLEQSAFPGEFFDAVTLWDVLEHLHDPVATLREVYRILKFDGILLIRVPNASSWDAALFGRYWAGLDAPRHLYVFAPANLNALLKATGFQAKEWSSRIGAYTTFLLSVRFWSVAQKKASTLRDFLIKCLYHPVMRLVAAPIFYLTGFRLHGPSVVIVAVKKANLR